MRGLRARLEALARDPNPILVRELRAMFRTDLYVRFLYLSTGLVALFVLGVGASIAAGDRSPAEVGRLVFHLFFVATAFLISLVAPGFASASITSEREQRTWESLLLSGMSARRIVAGKFLAAFASIGLVVAALSPVVGIAFLFGGVSPVQVVVGLLSMLVALAPAIAFGVALSARLPSTRLAIAATTVLFVPIAAVYASALAGFGDAANSAWGLSVQGPFFYTDAFATRGGEWDTWALLGGGALYFFGMPVWFLLATAVAGVQPAAEDRSSALKRWAIAMAIATAAACATAVASADSPRHAGQMSMLCSMGLVALLLFLGLVFANEPPLPPRPWALRAAQRGVAGRLLATFGPGAASSLRFTLALQLGTGALVLGAMLLVRHLAFPHGSDEVRWDLGSAALVGGGTIVALSFAALTTQLRLALRHGLAARVLALALMFMTGILPFLIQMLISPSSVSRLDRETPTLVMLSSAYPLVLAIQMTDRHAGPTGFLGLLVTAGVYGLPALGLWAFVEARVRRVRAAVEARRGLLAGRASAPPGRPAAPTAPGDAPAEADGDGPGDGPEDGEPG